MKRTARGFAKATEAAYLSSHTKRMGAAVFWRNKLISIGWNSLKTHTKSETRAHLQHAEFAALIGCNKRELVGAEIYIVRILKNNTLAHSKPCHHCEQLLRAAGIKRAWYLDKDGNEKKMRIR